MDNPILTSVAPNIRRWNGKPGQYEVWYITLNDPASERAFWIRATLLAPKEGEPSGALWFVRFAPGETPRGWKVPISPPTGPALQAAAGEASWDLSIESSRKPFKPIPASLRGFVGTKIVTPHLDARISGVIRVGGEETRLKDAPGTQSHLWGRGYGRGWAWAHASFPGGVFEGLAGLKPAIASFYARHERMEWKMNTLLATARNRSIVRPSPRGWRFVGTTHNRELVGTITVDPRPVAVVEYVGPSDERIFCTNSGLATIRLELRARATFGLPWRTVARITAPAHFEYASREPLSTTLLFS